MKDHPLAAIFPLMEEAELNELADDIKEDGQRAPITTLDDKILDGRNRFRACKIAGVEPRFVQFKNGSDPLKFILAANLHRRHLTTGQRAVVAAKISNLGEGRPINTPPIGGVSQKQAAARLNVSERSVQRAKTVLEDKALTKAVEKGKKTLDSAVKEVAEKKKPKTSELDVTGYPIPDAILDDWNRAKAWSAVNLRKLSDVRTAIKDGLASKDVILREVTNTTIATVGNAYHDLSSVTPYAVCPMCQAMAVKTCQMCKERGWISKFLWHAVPVELKEVRSKSTRK